MREAFRAIDTSNTGIITKEQVKKGFQHDNHITHINDELIEKIFSRFANGQINYSQFLAATVDKQVALNKANLEFAFHHFDTENKGYITKSDLKEVFRRQGQKIDDKQLNIIIRQVHQEDPKSPKIKKQLSLMEEEELKMVAVEEQIDSSLLNPAECISLDDFMRIMQ